MNIDNISEDSVINTDLSIKDNNSTTDKVTFTESNMSDPLPIETLPKDSVKKVDKRSITSKLNAQKAREARTRKKQEREQRLKELFGEGGDSSSGESDSDASSSSDDEYVKQRIKKKKNIYHKQQKEIEELKDLVFKLATKQKKYKKKKRKSSKNEHPQPIINYNITHPEPKQETKKETPKIKDSVFMRSLRNDILDDL